MFHLQCRTFLHRKGEPLSAMMTENYHPLIFPVARSSCVNIDVLHSNSTPVASVTSVLKIAFCVLFLPTHREVFLYELECNPFLSFSYVRTYLQRGRLGMGITREIIMVFFRLCSSRSLDTTLLAFLHPRHTTAVEKLSWCC